LRTSDADAALVSLTKDESYLVVSAAARSLGKSKAAGSPGILKGLLRKNSWAEVVRSAALSGLAELNDEAHLDTLLEWSNYGKPLRARRAAIAAIPELGEGKKVRTHLEDMLHDRDPHVRSAVLSAISTLGDQKARGAVLSLLEVELDGRVRSKARDVLSELKSAGPVGLKEAQKENEKLAHEFADWKARLDSLEQLTKSEPKKVKVVEKKAPNGRRRPQKRGA
jgi:HEAT repeat protein